MRLVEAVGPDILTMLERGEVHLGRRLLQGVRLDASASPTHPVPPVELLAVSHPKFPLKRGNKLEIAYVS